jgi:hypothetical protein
MDDDSLNAVGAHCPTCGQEYRPGFTVCADDGTELVSGPAPEPSGAGEDEPVWESELDRFELGDSPVLLGSWPLQEAMLVSGRLRSLGMRAAAERNFEHGPYQTVDMLMSNPVGVYVAEEDLERARRVIQRIEERAGNEP